MKENIARLTEAEQALLNAAATIGAIYKTLGMVHDDASAAAFITSLRNNAPRVEALVLRPAAEIIGKVPS